MTSNTMAHRLIAIVASDRLRPISRNGYDRTALFRDVPDERGVTHIDALSGAISSQFAIR